MPNQMGAWLRGRFLWNIDLFGAEKEWLEIASMLEEEAKGIPFTEAPGGRGYGRFHELRKGEVRFMWAHGLDAETVPIFLKANLDHFAAQPGKRAKVMEVRLDSSFEIPAFSVHSLFFCQRSAPNFVLPICSV